MAENNNPVSEPIQKSAQAANMIRGAVKTGKALAGAAKGAAAGGPAGAAVGFLWSNRKLVGKIIIGLTAFMMIPVMIICMLPSIIFGWLFGGGAQANPTTPILNDNAAIQRNLTNIQSMVNSVLSEALTNIQADIQSDFSASGADGIEVNNPYIASTDFNVNLFISQYCAASSADYTTISIDHMEGLLRQEMEKLYSYTRKQETRTVQVTEMVDVKDPETGKVTQQEVTSEKTQIWLIYTIAYIGESYFAGEVFHLTPEQKALAADYASNLELFLSTS